MLSPDELASLVAAGAAGGPAAAESAKAVAPGGLFTWVICEVLEGGGVGPALDHALPLPFISPRGTLRLQAALGLARLTLVQ